MTDAERLALYEALTLLEPSQWDELRIRLPRQERHLPTAPATPASLAAALVKLCRQNTGLHRQVASWLQAQQVPQPAPLVRPPHTTAVIVAVRADLSASIESVAAMLRRHAARITAITHIDPTVPGALASASRAGLRIVLIGAATGGETGAEVLGKLLDRGALSARTTTRTDESMDAFEDDFRHANRLRRRCRLTFDDPQKAGSSLSSTVETWLSANIARPDPGAGTSLLPWESHYLGMRQVRWREGSTNAVDTHADIRRARSSRASLYVSLHAGHGPWKRYGDGRVRLRDDDRGAGIEEASPILLDELIGVTRALAVVGEAGTGKSVLLEHIAHSLRCHLDSEPLPEQADRLNLDILGTGCPLPVRLPILIRASEVADAITEHGESDAMELTLCKALGSGVTREQVRSGIKAGRYLLLVDSLDEVPETRRREATVHLLASFATMSDRCRLVLTTRPGAHTNVTLPAPFRSVTIAPLNPDLQAAMVARWSRFQGLTETQQTDLQEALRGLEDERFPTSREDLSPLKNPWLLHCTMLVFIEKNRLPENTAELFRLMVRILCASRPESTLPDGRCLSDTTREDILQQVAYELQRAGRTALSIEQLSHTIKHEPSHGLTAGDHAYRAIDHLAATTGILRLLPEEGRWVVRPWHRSFQEYLAARYLVTKNGTTNLLMQALLSSTQQPLTNPQWEGCMRFLTGVLGRDGGNERAQNWIVALLAEADRNRSRPQKEGRLLALAAEGVAEYAREYFNHHDLLVDVPAQVVERFADSGAQWGWRDRVMALGALGRLTDPRLGDPTTVCSGWTETAWGWMRNWPVTVGEYAQFMAASGYANDALWEGPRPEAAEPRDWARQKRLTNHPVVGVSWWEARAFCRWAQEAWKPPGAGLVDLPTREEWTSGTRGKYPWGDEPEPGKGDAALANYRWGSDAPGTTTPVGAFPLGNVDAMVDLAGNIWEWSVTLTTGEEVRMTADAINITYVENKVSRLFSGGSWGSSAGNLRCAVRGGRLPDRRVRGFGFRVVCRRSPNTLLPSRDYRAGDARASSPAAPHQ